MRLLALELGLELLGLLLELLGLLLELLGLLLKRALLLLAVWKIIVRLQSKETHRAIFTVVWVLASVRLLLGWACWGSETLLMRRAGRGAIVASGRTCRGRERGGSLYARRSQIDSRDFGHCRLTGPSGLSHTLLGGFSEVFTQYQAPWVYVVRVST